MRSKLGKGVLLLAAAIGAFGLVHRDLEDVAVGWAMAVLVDPDSRLARAALVRLGVLDDRRLVALGIGGLFYAGLLLTEGIGRWLHKRWTEYVTVLATVLLISALGVGADAESHPHPGGGHRDQRRGDVGTSRGDCERRQDADTTA
jgi:hypothetical protein